MNGYASNADNKISFMIAIAVVIATVAFVVYTFAGRGRVIQIEYGAHTVSARVADNEKARRVGLGGVTRLHPNEGLLMVYDTPGNHAIWMKDMVIPIDVLWLDDSGQVVHIEKSMKPDSYPTSYSSRDPATYVLELSEGAANRMNINIGSTLDIQGDV